MAKAKATTASQFSLPAIRTGVKVQGVVIKKIDAWVLVDCAGGVFTGIILSKEVKDLERNGYDLSIGKELEAEIMDTDTRSDEWYFIISIAKLIQYDVWKNIAAKSKDDDIITVVPTEANLGWLLVDMHGIKGFIPLSQLAPVHYPRVEDGDQEKIFEKLLNLVGKEFRVRIINLDEENKRIVLSEREALKEEREKILGSMKVGNEYEGTVSGISSYWVFVTIGGGIEGLVHISELTYGHVANVDRLAKVGSNMIVRIIGFEDGKISLSAKQLKDDPWSIIPKKFKIGDIIEGEVVRFVPYWVFVRIYDDINGLIHLSELSERNVSNPAELVRLGQVVKAKLIALDPSQRKIGLSVKALTAPSTPAGDKPAKAPAKKAKSLDDVEDSTADAVAEKASKKPAKEEKAAE
jgi:small subunit ribosomal protein S1